MGKQKKHWKPDDPCQNFFLAEMGNKFSGDAWQLLDDWQYILALMPQPGQFDLEAMKFYGTTKRIVLREFNKLSRETTAYVAAAILQRDGSFLRELAELAENAEQQRDPVRVWLFNVHFQFRPKPVQEFFYTIPELVKAAKQRGDEIDPHQMRRLCHEMGIKYKPDKRGYHKD